jgi:hypothetical protein
LEKSHALNTIPLDRSGLKQMDERVDFSYFKLLSKNC